MACVVSLLRGWEPETSPDLSLRLESVCLFIPYLGAPSFSPSQEEARAKSHPGMGSGVPEMHLEPFFKVVWEATGLGAPSTSRGETWMC